MSSITVVRSTMLWASKNSENVFGLRRHRVKLENRSEAAAPLRVRLGIEVDGSTEIIEVDGMDPLDELFPNTAGGELCELRP